MLEEAQHSWAQHSWAELLGRPVVALHSHAPLQAVALHSQMAHQVAALHKQVSLQMVGLHNQVALRMAAPQVALRPVVLHAVALQVVALHEAALRSPVALQEAVLHSQREEALHTLEVDIHSQLALVPDSHRPVGSQAAVHIQVAAYYSQDRRCLCLYSCF